MEQCQATTKAGTQCRIEAEPGGSLCHVHEPSLQCGMPKRNGKPCTIATGGKGPCPVHRQQEKPDWQKSRTRKNRTTLRQRQKRREERGAPLTSADLDALLGSK